MAKGIQALKKLFALAIFFVGIADYITKFLIKVARKLSPLKVHVNIGY